jgi:ATP-binding protein involved in chromosome partitioning
MEGFEKINMPNVKKIIAVASGKGGVGKSTVSVNLSVALARQGLKVALVDADIYGPSIPKMFGIEDLKPQMTKSGKKDMMLPIEKFGVKIMSIGFFVGKSQGLIWRGPMAANAMSQLFQDTCWGELDYMIIDFPPGTGDIQLTTIQKLDLDGVILVTTPQEISLNDARKAASMFVNKDINIPIIGVVENMSWFTPRQHPDEKYFLFGRDGGEKIAAELNARLLGKIPLVIEAGEAAEKGLSVFSQNDVSIIHAFEEVIEHIC